MSEDLKDKNGKEIYEGDIVHLQNGNSKPQQVIIEFNEDSACFHGRIIEGRGEELFEGYTYHLLYKTFKMEIIGNVYKDSYLVDKIPKLKKE